MLATGATGTVGIDSDVLLVNEKLLGDLGHHSDSGGARVHAALLLSLGDPLYFVDTRLVLQVLVDLLPGDLVDTQLATLVDGHVRLEILLHTTPAHSLTIRFVHCH